MEDMLELDSPSAIFLDSISDNDSKQLEAQRALEVLTQILQNFISESLISLPKFSESNLITCIEEINKFLSAHHTYQDPELISYLGRGLQKAFNDYLWKDYLKQNLYKHWSSIVSNLSSSKASSFFPRIDELIKSCRDSLEKLLKTLADLFLTTPVKYDVFPQVLAFDYFFTEMVKDLRRKTKKLKIQLKFCPGVEPPTIKRVQYETFTVEKKNYTEWNTFSEEESVEIEKVPACTMVPLVHRLFSLFTDRSKAVVSYYAPVGWEVTRVNAFVIDGFFKETNIKRSVCRDNKAMVEIEVIYPRIVKENIWCRVRLEGVISRKRILDVRVPHIKDILVVVDENGEHELPEGIIDFDDIDIE